MMLSTYDNLRNTMGYNGAVVLNNKETDVYVQAAFVSHQLIKRKHPLVSCQAMLPKEVVNIIFPLHIITGSVNKKSSKRSSMILVRENFLDNLERVR